MVGDTSLLRDEREKEVDMLIGGLSVSVIYRDRFMMELWVVLM